MPWMSNEGTPHRMLFPIFNLVRSCFWNKKNKQTNINHKGLQRTANEHTEERRIYKDLISKNEK